MTGIVVWFTGLPASGKSLLAESVARRLREESVPIALLDGDTMREVLAASSDYSPAGRDAFYESLARLAALLAIQNLTVLVPATAHRRAFRERARSLAPRFLEVFVDVSPDECARRDPKGLYAAAAAGRIHDLPGMNADYEKPEEPDVIATGGLDAEAVTEVLDLVTRARRGPG